MTTLIHDFNCAGLIVRSGTVTKISLSGTSGQGNPVPQSVEGGISCPAGSLRRGGLDGAGAPVATASPGDSSGSHPRPFQPPASGTCLGCRRTSGCAASADLGDSGGGRPRTAVEIEGESPGTGADASLHLFKKNRSKIGDSDDRHRPSCRRSRLARPAGNPFRAGLRCARP